jgi:hypothetical protein
VAAQKTCFVIMGYGVKVDYRTGRELDLDKTYHNVIKPAVEELDFKCIRADEVRHSGIIDVPMYEWLIGADVVIADLSTSNPNAFYELGVRHALRPHTTIAISESKLEPPFDVNHTVIRSYEHLGQDIGYSETMRFRQELKETLVAIVDSPRVDSPVYTYLKDLDPPRYGAPFTVPVVSDRDTLSSIIGRAKEALDTSEFRGAITLFELAREIDNESDYILQQLILATYKSKYPTHVDSLKKSLELIEELTPEETTDTETLGLTGAVYKQLWEETGEPNYLSEAIRFYEKGFRVKNDYYNGINFAFLLNVRANVSDGDEAVADRVLAKRTRQQVIEICQGLMKDNFDERGDKYWVAATLEEAYFGLGDTNNYEKSKAIALSLVEVGWERETTEEQLTKLKNLI